MVATVRTNFSCRNDIRRPITNVTEPSGPGESGSDPGHVLRVTGITVPMRTSTKPVPCADVLRAAWRFPRARVRRNPSHRGSTSTTPRVSVPRIHSLIAHAERIVGFVTVPVAFRHRVRRTDEARNCRMPEEFAVGGIDLTFKGVWAPYVTRGRSG